MITPLIALHIELNMDVTVFLIDVKILVNIVFTVFRAVLIPVFITPSTFVIVVLMLLKIVVTVLLIAVKIVLKIVLMVLSTVLMVV